MCDSGRGYRSDGCAWTVTRLENRGRTNSRVGLLETRNCDFRQQIPETDTRSNRLQAERDGNEFDIEKLLEFQRNSVLLRVAGRSALRQLFKVNLDELCVIAVLPSAG